MKLSDFLLEQNDDPNKLVLVLRDYLDGNVTKEDVMEVIPEITEIKGNGALLKFDDYWDLFSGDETTKIHIPYIIYDRYGYGYEPFVNDGQEQNDWEEGYGFYIFNDEQRKKLNTIMSFVFSNKEGGNCDFDNQSNCTKVISDFISEQFDSQLQDIFYYIEREKSSEIKRELREELFSDFPLPLPKKLLQMMVIEPYKSFVVTIPQLLNFIEKNNNGFNNLTEMITQYNYENDYYPNYEDGFFEYGHGYDQTGLQELIQELLSSMEEEIIEEGKFSSVKEYYSILQDFDVHQNELSSFPKDSIYGHFKIKTFIPEENKVVVSVSKKTEPFKFYDYKLSFDGVRDLLTTYSLF